MGSPVSIEASYGRSIYIPGLSLCSPKKPTADTAVQLVACESPTSDVTSALESLLCDGTESLLTLGLGCRLFLDSLPLFPCRTTRLTEPD